MKKSLITLTIMLAAVAMVAVFSCPALAQVSGQCSNCHTMHDSQGGTAMATGGPLAALLLNSCIGCHTGTGDPLHNTNNTPYVMSSTSGFSDNLCLAGGFFPATMVAGNNADQHHGVISTNTSPPAGFDSADNTWYTGTSDGLGCAGTNGCHGNETDLSDMDAIKGGHHKTSSTYRMLYVGTDTVSGSPAEDYEENLVQNPTTITLIRTGAGQNVNIYSAGTLTSGTEDTISELCAKCHGIFHGENTGSDSDGTKNIAGEWIRHPSDAALPTGWEMGAATYAFDGNDAKNNPFGYTDATYTVGGTQVTCLSCHRAHGTENNDLLRWAYSTQTAGTLTADYGCLGCHDAQR